MIDGKSIKKVFGYLKKEDYYSDDAFEKISQLKNYIYETDVDPADICECFEEAKQSELDKYKNLVCDKYFLKNGKVLIHIYDI